MSDVAYHTRPQILLHWVIVALVLAPFLTAEAMEAFFDKAEDAGVLAGFRRRPVPWPTRWAGGTILFLMLVRLALRGRYGAPPPPSTLSPPLRLAARTVHYVFYVLLLLLPATGAVALYVNAEAGDVHAVLKTVLLILILAHVAGALVHAFVLKDGVIWRMLPRA